MAKKQYPAKSVVNNPTPKTDQEHNQVSIHHQSYQHSGPLPDPITLSRYNEIVPTAAERIIAMAEENARHYREMEKKALEAQIKDFNDSHTDTRIGQLFGLVSVIGAFSLACYALSMGHSTVAGTICSVTVIGLVTVFVTGRKGGQEESNQESLEKEKHKQR